MGALLWIAIGIVVAVFASRAIESSLAEDSYMNRGTDGFEKFLAVLLGCIAGALWPILLPVGAFGYAIYFLAFKAGKK